jgi:hypothetical protein
MGLAVCGTTVRAESIDYHLNDVTARLHDAPCANATVKQLLGDSSSFHAADITWQGQALGGCWAAIESQVVIVDETGDAGVLSPEGFADGHVPVALRWPSI